jgi:hypothetical protein
MDKRAFIAAAQFANLELMKFIESVSLKGGKGIPTDWCQDASEAAAEGGYLEVLKWLCDIGWRDYSGRSFEILAKHGRTDQMKWLYKHGSVRMSETSMCFLVAGLENVDFLKWLHNNGHCTDFWIPELLNDG